jgi:hypothetical protein
MFTLTDTNQIACHGTSFRTFNDAKTYAIYLQSIGLCVTFSIGCYLDGKHVGVFDSGVA